MQSNSATWTRSLWISSKLSRTPGAISLDAITAFIHFDPLADRSRFKVWRCNFSFQVDTTDKYWLTKSTAWDRNKENVFFVHGYASGDNAPPKYVMQDSLEQSNRYNAFILDYGRVSRAPCYVQMAQNYHYVSHCLASFINTFVKMGMRAESVICIGHSMGAQICGRLKKHLRFRLKKIIGKWCPVFSSHTHTRFCAISTFSSVNSVNSFEDSTRHYHSYGGVSAWATKMPKVCTLSQRMPATTATWEQSDMLTFASTTDSSSHFALTKKVHIFLLFSLLEGRPTRISIFRCIFVQPFVGIVFCRPKFVQRLPAAGHEVHASVSTFEHTPIGG